ncbi:Uncharacterised protein [Achromobacter spanius]|uniref:hypothetical protein n=1 Tax=Achromobacter spanius TaxID=217203 RepID=UPI000C2B5399|nr:hypothetical protein [Achromobacter spanius]AUA59075.1 hypothetical protein CVS48_25535 [Achromobacter spanius]CAB3706600.1 hypothetical protein LMG5911_05288 [Achromobacter spanius]SPT40496.1 Uncharacterised protein [Achromobacter denitrificans]VEE58747.1 Uncharacterised protein [Achromobacter spanius]
MSTSNLKPSKYQLESNLDQYRVGAGAHQSDLEFEVLQTICKAADKAMRLAARTALVHVPEHLKDNLFPTLTAGNSPLPMATQVGNGAAYRISIPISFVDKLLSITPTRGGRPPREASDYFISSAIVAVLAAYGHEMNHVFAGHLGMPSSKGQETHSDYIGGGLLWAWLHDEEIAALCRIPNGKQVSMCAYGFLHLISVLGDSDHDRSLYLPRCLRLNVFFGGAGFCAEQRGGRAQGDLVGDAFQAMPACPDSDFESSAIRSQHVSLMVQMKQPQMMTRLQTALQDMRQEKSDWYTSSKHLSPIKKDLRRALKRDSS